MDQVLSAGRTKDAFAVFQEDYAYDAEVLVDTCLKKRRAGDSPDPLSLLEDTLAVRERLLGPTAPETLSCRVQLSLAYWNADKQSQAISMLKLVLKHRNEELGSHHPDSRATALRLNELRSKRKGRWWKTPRP
ncbi:tetratricopeptide repeat protein [Streptomyces yangpuensis]|uniref:tetratricopeptide repeat protein n=1 Tax=Streptomyces yangpuensis TaxID=1648182 RepID=UPI0036526813